MSGRVGAEQTPDIEAVAARLFLADPTRPGPGPWMSLHESGQLPYLSMAQAALDTLAPVLAAAVREAEQRVEAAEAKVAALTHRHGEGGCRWVGTFNLTTGGGDGHYECPYLAGERELLDAAHEITEAFEDADETTWGDVREWLLLLAGWAGDSADRIAVDAPEGGEGR